MKFLIFLVLILSSISSFAATTDTVAPKTFAQRIDHFNPHDRRTFSQRYWFDDRYVVDRSKAPVMLFICSESRCTDEEWHGGIERYAKDHKAYMIALEHRFYGDSQPFATLTTENLKYLRIKQVLADLAYFTKAMQKEHSINGGWVTVGGSYAGMLSAYYRAVYPKLTVGAIASGAPVQPRQKQFVYDEYAAHQAGESCVANIKRSIKQIEDIFASGDKERIETLRKQFKAESIKDDWDLFTFVTDIASFAVQYGFRDQICKEVPDDQVLKNYIDATNAAVDKIGLERQTYSLDFMRDERIATHDGWISYRQFTYQQCVDIGLWIISNPDQNWTMRSIKLDRVKPNQYCQKVYGINANHVKNTLQPLYDKLRSPKITNIIFPNGSHDPWVSLSVTPENARQINPNLKALIMEGQPHCADIRPIKPTDNEILKKARDEISELIGTWLKN